MLSYPLTEAETLLRSKLDAAQSSLENCDEDLDFLREQITVSIKSFVVLGGFLDVRADYGADYGGRYGTGVQLGRK